MLYSIVLMFVDAFSLTFTLLLIVFLISRLIAKDIYITSKFYALFITYCILDAFFMCDQYLNRRLAYFGYFRDFYTTEYPKSALSSITFVYFYSYGIAMSLSNISVAFNRLSAISFPVYYNQLWKGWKLMFFISFPMTICFIHLWYFMDIKIEYQLFGDGSMVPNFRPDSKVDLWFFLILVRVFSFIVSGYMHYLLITQLRNKISIKKTAERNPVSAAELNLIKYAQVFYFVTTFTLIFEGILMLCGYFKWRDVINLMDRLYLPLETMQSFFSPYTLVYINKDIRQKFFEFLHLKKKRFVKKSTITSAVSFTVSRGTM
uniref:Serpentine receptor class gamma n=1 Tax=Rhabditophanes sp. KR3021 TaxID=114890 RepID=A0AC35U7V2_9BILA